MGDRHTDSIDRHIRRMLGSQRECVRWVGRLASARA